MSTLEKIEKDLVDAQKARDERTTSTLRMVKSSLKNKEIEIQKPLEESDVIEVLIKEAKKRKESASAYEQGGRPELAEKETAEFEIISKYLPEQLSEEAVRNIVKQTITETGAASPADMGRVIGTVMGKVKGQADGGLVSKLVKEELNK